MVKVNIMKHHESGELMGHFANILKKEECSLVYKTWYTKEELRG